MIITDCNCGKKLSCGCTLSFSSYAANSLSVLDVGNLQGGTCSLDKYVIDWYRNGQLYLTSGKGNDPDIDAFHPFTGTGAIPVPGGTYVPVLRYVVLAGQTTKIFSTRRNCQDWCNFSGTLPTITVSSLDCSSQNITGDYQYKISYTTTQDFALATRKVNWFVDASTKWMAFYFQAQSVADRIDIFYKEETTPIQSWIVGSRLNTYQYATMPYKHAATGLYLVMELPAYTAGDYYTIQVTPSVLETNINTEWYLSIKCLTDSVDFFSECADFDPALRTYDVSTITMTWNASACRYEMKMNLVNNPTAIWIQSRMHYKYGLIRGLASNNFIYDWVNNPYSIGIRLTQNLIASSKYYPSYTAMTCTAAHGTNNISVNGNVVTLTFDNDTDYNLFKNKYDLIVAAGMYSGWVNDPTNIDYYRDWRFNWYRTITQCGDNQLGYGLYIHASWPLTWTPDPGNGGTLEISVSNITMGYTGQTTCDGAPGQLQNAVNSYNSFLTNMTNLSGNTVVIPSNAGYGAGWYAVNNSITNTYGGQALRGVKAVQLCDVNSLGFCDGTQGNTEWYLFELRVIITAAKDANGIFLEDPVDNFQVWDMRNHTTGCRTTELKIYEIVGGVQIVP